MGVILYFLMKRELLRDEGTRSFDSTIELVTSRLDNVADLNHLVGHVDHRLVKVVVLEAEDLLGGRVVEEVDVLVRVYGCLVRGDGPAERPVLVDDGLRVLLERGRAVADDEAAVSSPSHLDGLQVSLGSVADIDNADVVGADRLHCAKHNTLAPL